MAEHVWRTFAAGSLGAWKGGMICFPPPEDPDAPYFPEFPDFLSPATAPDWISDLQARIDRALPGVPALLACLDPDSLTLDPCPPAFRMPQLPSASEAGLCLASARVLLACREELLPPAFTTAEEACSWIEQASWMALMMGGEHAFLTALAAVSDPSSFAFSDPREDIGDIELEEGEGT